jgi:hypothetical protein
VVADAAVAVVDDAYDADADVAVAVVVVAVVADADVAVAAGVAAVAVDVVPKNKFRLVLELARVLFLYICLTYTSHTCLQHVIHLKTTQFLVLAQHAVGSLGIGVSLFAQGDCKRPTNTPSLSHRLDGSRLRAPLREDCETCQEESAQDRPDRSPLQGARSSYPDAAAPLSPHLPQQQACATRPLLVDGGELFPLSLRRR